MLDLPQIWITRVCYIVGGDWVLATALLWRSFVNLTLMSVIPTDCDGQDQGMIADKRQTGP